MGSLSSFLKCLQSEVASPTPKIKLLPLSCDIIKKQLYKTSISVIEKGSFNYLQLKYIYDTL